MPVEVANTLRRAALAGGISVDTASLAHTDLLSLNVQLYDYAGRSARVWDLRGSLAAYDACYVALAEWLDVPLATLDARLACSPGPRCLFAMPPV
jgi:predicted nucleic acid-binding protein